MSGPSFLKERGAPEKMHYHPNKVAFLCCLLCAMAAGLISGPAGANNQSARTQAAAKAAKAAEQAEIVRFKKAIVFYRLEVWHKQDAVLSPRTPTSYSERRISSPKYLRWSAKLWRHRWQATSLYIQANPWLKMLRLTQRYRGCLIKHESRTSGLYKAENGGTRYADMSRGDSNASGAYQFLDGTWQTRLAAAKRYFGRRLKGYWSHAADAPPKVQDIVAAYDIVADHGIDWTHSQCRQIGLRA